MQDIWKQSQGLKVTEQMFCDQARMIMINGWLAEFEIYVTRKVTMNENTDKNDQNNDNDDDDDQGDATGNKWENLENVLQNNAFLSFQDLERMNEKEEIMIKSTLEISDHNLDEEVYGFKKVYRNLLNKWTMKVNAILKEIKSDNITEIKD